MPRSLTATVALVSLLMLAGCAGAGNTGDAGTPEATPDAAPATEAADAETATGGGRGAAGVAVPAVDRKWIHTANATLRVDDFAAARSNLSATLSAHGGYVGNSRVDTYERHNETYRDARLVYRVPAGNYSAFVAAVKAAGTVEHFEEDAQDVTGRHADLEARLSNLRTERDRLRELYEQANDTEAVLAVQRELSNVQGEIERTEARLESLENRIAYATVTVEFREERPDTPRDQDHWYDTGVVAAFLDSVGGAVVALRAAVVAFAYALPYLVAFGVPAAVLVAGVRRLRRRGLGLSVPGLGDGEGSDGD